MLKKNIVEAEGEVIEAFPDASFKIKLESGQEILGYISGKMRQYHIRILVGDRVKIEMSPYDLARGRIVYRYK